MSASAFNEESCEEFVTLQKIEIIYELTYHQVLLLLVWDRDGKS